MVTTDAPRGVLPRNEPDSQTSPLWRLAGALTIAHVALLLIGVSFEKTPLLGSAADVTTSDLITGSMSRTYAGGYVEFLGFLVFLVDAVLLAQLLRGRSETSRWLSSSASAAGVTYVAISIAAGAAALYDGHHGASLQVVTTVNDVRNFAFFLSIPVLGVFTLALAALVRRERLLPQWISWSGWVVGVVCIVCAPAARVGGADYGSLLFFVWFVALGVTALRVRRATAPPVTATA
jgi:hypothetical protein